MVFIDLYNRVGNKKLPVRYSAYRGLSCPGSQKRTLDDTPPPIMVGPALLMA